MPATKRKTYKHPALERLLKRKNACEYMAQGSLEFASRHPTLLAAVEAVLKRPRAGVDLGWFISRTMKGALDNWCGNIACTICEDAPKAEGPDLARAAARKLDAAEARARKRKRDARKAKR